ncbi:MAG: hypothetical protein ACXW3L_01900, partial [Limisphaerales bacterium]
MKNSINPRLCTAIIAAFALLAVALPVHAGEKAVKIISPNAKFHGKSYGEWSAAFWQYALALPVEGHPFLNEEVDFSAGQKGSVWFWSAPDGPFTRHISMPPGKALFLTIRDVEVSTLEEPPFFGATEEEQRTQANWFADRIVDLSVTINGVPVPNLGDFRFTSPQFTFTAPTPWVFGDVGGTGTAVSDGYFLMLVLPKGHHTIHYTGTFRFAAGELGDEAFDLPHE